MPIRNKGRDHYIPLQDAADRSGVYQRDLRKQARRGKLDTKREGGKEMVKLSSLLSLFGLGGAKKKKKK